MVKKCVLCQEKIDEDYGKLKGTIVKVKGEDGKNKFCYVCSNCQKNKNWLENAKVEG